MDGAEDVEGSGVGCDPVFGGMMRQLITILEQNVREFVVCRSESC